MKRGKNRCSLDPPHELDARLVTRRIDSQPPPSIEATSPCSLHVQEKYNSEHRWGNNTINKTPRGDKVGIALGSIDLLSKYCI